MHTITESSEVLLHQLAVTFYDQGNFEKASGMFRLLTLARPHDSRFWYGLGSCLMLLGFDEDALQPFQLASIYNEQDPRPIAYRAECLARLGKDSEAYAAFEQAHAICQEHGPEHFLEQICAMRGTYDNRKAL